MIHGSKIIQVLKMVVNTDQDRIKALLTEAITVLCKNGLGYDSEFTIDGLLGITVDKQDVFLVKINETINKEPRRKPSPVRPPPHRDSELESGSTDARYPSVSSTPPSDHVSSGPSAGHSFRKRSWHEPGEFHRTDNGKRRAALGRHGEDNPIVIKEEIMDSDDANDHDQYIQQTFGLSEPPPEVAYSAEESDTVHSTHESKSGNASWPSQGRAVGFSPASSIPSSPLPGGNTQVENFVNVTPREADGTHPHEALSGGQEESMAHILASHMMQQTALVLKGDAGRYAHFDMPHMSHIWPATLQRSRVFLQNDRPARPYSCTTCGKTFSSASGHKLHMNTHKGIYPYKCQYCGKGFTASNNLKAHITVHTKINSFLCSICGEGFRYSQYLKEHIDKEHRNGQTLSKNDTLSNT